MQLLALLIITKCLAISSSEPKYKFAPVPTNFSIILPVENHSQTVFFDMDVHAHPLLKTFILQNSLLDKSVLLLNVYGSDIDIRVNITRDFIKTSDNPNVMIMTKYLTPKMVDSSFWRFFIKSSWSLVYIIITSDNEFKCKNGKMNPNDFSLLEDIMNTLWHRFQIMRVGVIFPFACKEKMVVYDGKKSSSRILYDRSIKLINASHFMNLSQAIKKSGEKLTGDYPMRASIFDRYPTSIKTCKNLHYYVNFNLNLTNGYCGLDGMVMHDILSHLKFNLWFPDDQECDNYGYAQPGNFSGALGCIIRSELDISFNSRFMTLYSDEHIYYLHYIKTDTLCAFIKKSDVIPLWHGVFNLFSPPLWALIGAVLVIIGGIMWATAVINRTMAGPETMTYWSYFYNTVMTTMLGYSPMKSRTLMMLRGACLVGSVFFLAVYQGHLSRIFTTVQRYKQIKTLEELYLSGATLYTSPSMRELIKQLQAPEDKLQATFFNRAHLMPGDRLEIILQKSNIVTVDRKSDADMEITQQFRDSHDTPLIDTVDECFYTYYLSYIARSGKNVDQIKSLVLMVQWYCFTYYPVKRVDPFWPSNTISNALNFDPWMCTAVAFNVARTRATVCGVFLLILIERFPFYEDLQVITERLNEAGLPAMYYKWTRQMLDIPATKTKRDIEPRAFFVVRLKDHRVAFVILFLGTIMSVIVFAIEMWKGGHHFKM